MNPFRKLLALAINHFAGAPIAFGIASNVAALTDAGEWQQIAPYGEEDYWEENPKKKGDWKKYRQVFGREQAGQMVMALNILKEKKGANFRGLPIFVGHPDARPDLWPDDKRLGGILELDARADGLYGRIAWNDVGEQNRAQGYYVYPSPAWAYDLAARASSGRIVPNELRSVGLTNTPRIQDVPAWTNTDPTLSRENQTENHTNTMPTWLIDKLIALGLLTKPAEGATNTEAEVQAAFGKLATSAQGKPFKLAINNKPFDLLLIGEAPAGISEEITAAINAATTPLKADVAKFRTLAINARLDAATKEGRLTAAERPGFLTKFEADFDDADTELKAKAVALNTGRIDLGRSLAADTSSEQSRRLAFNARLDELTLPVAQGGKGLSLDTAIAQMRANPADAALLEAMQPAKTA